MITEPSGKSSRASSSWWGRAGRPRAARSSTVRSTPLRSGFQHRSSFGQDHGAVEDSRVGCRMVLADVADPVDRQQGVQLRRSAGTATHMGHGGGRFVPDGFAQHPQPAEEIGLLRIEEVGLVPRHRVCHARCTISAAPGRPLDGVRVGIAFRIEIGGGQPAGPAGHAPAQQRVADGPRRGSAPRCSDGLVAPSSSTSRGTTAPACEPRSRCSIVFRLPRPTLRSGLSTTTVAASPALPHGGVDAGRIAPVPAGGKRDDVGVTAADQPQGAVAGGIVRHQHPQRQIARFRPAGCPAGPSMSRELL